ncbi:MAG TPA: hypothetical protein VEI06_10885 [Gemmatimonadaceae bacterium]|nr:hypothetical protein [Gemmatimonadaceae bacterium]
MRALARWRPWHVAAVCLAWPLLGPALTAAGIMLAASVLGAVKTTCDVSFGISLTGTSAGVGLALPTVLLVAAWLRARSLYPPGTDSLARAAAEAPPAE